ncbi:MAG TPA: hypothetical protein VFX38_05005, partial [Gammaproteobacteria bacterium]|nr:hypothetical protein [Gammaproteobacteria bacterium]
RDADIPILGVFLGRRRGLRITGVLPHFVAREDLFDPDFLWRYWRSPWLVLPRLLSPAIPLARILELFQAHPIHRIPEQSLAVVLGDLRRALGDRALGSVLNRWWAPRFRAAGADLAAPVSRLLAAESRYADLLGGGWGHRRLDLATFREFKPGERERIAAHLAVFARALAAGEAVMIAPEGANSPDGFFQRPRAGARWIAKQGGDELVVLPIGLAYDPAAGGRSRVFVHAGPAFRAGDHAGRREFDDAAACAILRATTLTGSHLAAHLVLRARAGEAMSAIEAGERIGNFASALAAAGLRVAADAGAELESRLGWFVGAGLLARRDGSFVRTQAGEPAPGRENRAALAAYLRNELASVVSLAPGLAQEQGLPAPSYRPQSAPSGLV